MNNKNCIIWTRVSTKYQEENGGSLDYQKAICERYAVEKGGLSAARGTHYAYIFSSFDAEAYSVNGLDEVSLVAVILLYVIHLQYRLHSQSSVLSV